MASFSEVSSSSSNFYPVFLAIAKLTGEFTSLDVVVSSTDLP
jgi:hypothetical protein